MKIMMLFLGVVLAGTVNAQQIAQQALPAVAIEKPAPVMPSLTGDWQWTYRFQREGQDIEFITTLTVFKVAPDGTITCRQAVTINTSPRRPAPRPCTGKVYLGDDGVWRLTVETKEKDSYQLVVVGATPLLRGSFQKPGWIAPDEITFQR